MFDPPGSVTALFPQDLCQRYSFASFNGAAAIIRHNAPKEFDQLILTLRQYRTRLVDICRPGGNRGPTTRLFGKIAARNGFLEEVVLSTEFHWSVRVGGDPFLEWRTGNEMHSHKVDHWSNRVALDFEWNSKDQTYDRDLLAMRQYFDLGIISAAVIVTRELSPQFTKFFPSLEVFDPRKAYHDSQLSTRLKIRGMDLIQIRRDGKLQTLHSKMGASTTGLSKLSSRLLSGRGGACPVLVVGITERNVIA